METATVTGKTRHPLPIFCCEKRKAFTNCYPSRGKNAYSVALRRCEYSQQVIYIIPLHFLPRSARAAQARLKIRIGIVLRIIQYSPSQSKPCGACFRYARREFHNCTAALTTFFSARVMALSFVVLWFLPRKNQQYHVGTDARTQCHLQEKRRSNANVQTNELGRGAQGRP